MTALPPRIGITTYREQATFGVWDEPADLLPTTYADAIHAAGGVPLLLPPAVVDGELEAAAESVLNGLHGLVLSGGADVDPARYHAAREAETGQARSDRDEWEIALVAATLRRHEVELADGSRLAKLLGLRTDVATYHHQSVDKLPDSVEAIGWTDDRTVEAFEVCDATWAIGVQWHPEVHNGLPLFTAFVDAGRAWRDHQPAKAVTP